MVIVLLVNLYASRVLLEVIGVEDYGIHGVVAGFVTLFSFLNTSLANGIQRFYNFNFGKSGVEGANKVFCAAILTQIVLAILTTLPLELFGMWYLHHKMVIPLERMTAAEWVFHCSIITYVLHILQVPFTASVMAHERMSFYAYISVFYAVFLLAGIQVLPVLGGDSLIAYGMLIALASLIQLLISMVYTRQQFEEIRIRLRIEKELLFQMITFSGWNILGTLSAMFKEQGVNLILNLFFGPIVNAARQIAYQVSTGLQSFVSNVITPTRPQIVQSYAQEDYHRAYELTYSISKVSCYVLYIAALPVMLEIDFILRLWLGDNVPDHTAILVVLVIIDSFLANLNSSISAIVHASGKMKLYQISGGIMNMLGLAMAYWGVRIFGLPEAAFYLMIIADILRQLVAIIVLKQIEANNFTYRTYIQKVVVPLIRTLSLACIIPIVTRLSMDAGFIRFITTTVVSVSSVGIITYLWGLSKREKELIRLLLQKRMCPFKQAK